jgi:outer membrane murein-binding lipoprotein Lpp
MADQICPHVALQRLSSTLETEGVNALAAAGLVLCACINDARLVINPDLDPKSTAAIHTLASIKPEYTSALAAACVVLCSCISDARIMISSTLAPDLAAATGELRNSLYALHVAVFGSADQIPAALAAFLSVAESGVFRG